MSIKACACGCREKLPPPTPQNPRQNQRFVAGHQNRTPEFRALKSETRTKPPKGWDTPSGQCACGCGQETSIAKSSNPSRDYYAGYPRRFIRGHHMRLRTGAQRGNWKGGRYLQDGYVMIRVEGRKFRYEAEHRLIWEAANGPIPKRHHVHHKNEVKTDNRLENLECLSMGEHKTRHQHGELPAHNHFVTDGYLLAAFRDLGLRLKRPPVQGDFLSDNRKANGVPQWSTYHRRFGSMARVRELAAAL